MVHLWEKGRKDGCGGALKRAYLEGVTPPTATETVASPQQVFGRRVRAARVERGIRVKEAARAVEVTHGGLWKLEEGWSPPWLATMERLARLLHVPVSWLAGAGSDEVPVRSLPVMDEDAIRYAFGQRVRFAREARGLSQEALAPLVGCSRTRVSAVENGQRMTPTLRTICRFCDALNMPVEWALGDDPDVGWLEAEPWDY